MASYPDNLPDTKDGPSQDGRRPNIVFNQKRMNPENRAINKRSRYDDDDDKNEDENESKMADELQGFVVDEEEGIESESESDESSDGELEEDEQDLIAENLGRMAKKKQRHVVFGEDEHLEEEESDINDFIDEDDEEGLEEMGGHRPKPNSKEDRFPFSDQALEDAREIFGGDFMSDDEEGTEGMDDVEEAANSRRIADIESDEDIQKKDQPERHQLRCIPLTRADESELCAEAHWIYTNVLCAFPITQQEFDQSLQPINPDHVKAALNFIRNHDFEVPYIAFYLKEYVDTLHISNLWKIYHWDEKWCELQTRKRNLSQLFQRMKDYYKSVGVEWQLTNEDEDEISKIQNQEELQDVYSYFLLYYGRDIPKMTAYEKLKEAQENGDFSEQQPMPKQASRRDKYSICADAGLGSLSKFFGLTPKQFAQNLEAEYMVDEPEQHAEEPLKTAEGFVSSQFPTPEQVLKGAVYMVAMQLAREPLVRRVIRQKYRNRALISVRPTKKGRKEIDENHPIYPQRYLKDNPAKEFKNEEFLKLVQAEEDGLVKMTISVDSLEGDKQQLAKGIIEIPIYRRDEFSKTVTEWNALRDEAVTMCFEQILYPNFEKELRSKMIQEARQCVLKACAQKCNDFIKVAPFPLETKDSEQQPTVMAIAYTMENDQASFGVVLDKEGEVIDHLRLLHLMKRRNSFKEAERRAKEQELETIKRFITAKNVRVISVAGEDMNALMIHEDLESVSADLEADGQISHRIDVELLDNNLAKVYMDSNRAQSEFPDFPLLLRQAISLARRILDPLLEFSQLCNPDDEILCLKFHPLQDMIPKDDLLSVLMCEVVNRVNEVGVDVNWCLEHPHTASVLQFVCGFGLKKAAYVLKQVRQNGGILETRKQLETTILANQKQVYINCAGFIKIDTKRVAEKSEVYVDPLDGSRIHPVDGYDWARKMAIDALEYVDMSEDANPAGTIAIEEILESPKRLKDLDLDAYAEELERQGFGNKNITLHNIRAELIHRYKDLRPKYRSLNQEDIFYSLTKETQETFAYGKLVSGRVTSMAYRRKKQIGVRVLLENGVNGFISMENISDKGVKNLEKRVTPGTLVHCRILKVDPTHFSADLTCKSKDLRDQELRFKPLLDRYYDFQTEEKDRDEDQHQQVAMMKKEQYFRRVIAHHAFHNCTLKEAERMLAKADQGEVIIRPSSKGNDHLTVTWKVADGVYQHIDVKEEEKENAFSLGRALYIGEELFEDLDEIMARHVNPIAANVREILNYKYYFPSSDRDEIEKHLKEEKENNPSRIPYILTASKEYPGKFLLSSLPNTTVRHEYLTAVVNGFRYRTRVFRNMNDLLKWFKQQVN